jgi:AraC-like DNA-binding protein
MLSIEKQIAVHELEMLYNTEKTESENLKLSDSVQQMKTRIRNISLLLLVGLIVVIVISIFALFIYRLYKQRDVAYNTLFDQLKSGNATSNLLIKLDELHNRFTGMDQNSAPSVIHDIITWLESEKPYLDSKLRLEDVARRFSMNRITLSNEIYAYSGMHFIAFINSYRVAEALKLLSQPESNNYKIETIALKAGFGSRAAFYDAFTKVTGNKPSEFRNEGT